jgi:uncharacterized membrane protein YedE/YeeE
MGSISPATWVVLGGFVLAFIFGAVANKTNFCTMGAISDVVNMEHWGRARMWLLTIVVAVAGTSALQYFGQIDVTMTIYQRSVVPWLSLLWGGVVFGVGMTLAGGCVNKNLVRLGAGSVRSLVVLAFVGISASMTLRGLFAQWRVYLLDPVTFDLAGMGMGTQSLAEMLSKWTGMDGKTSLLLVAAVLCLALLIFAFKDKRFRANANQVWGGLVLGLLVVGGWYLTGHVGFGENPETLETVYFATNTRTLESMSFVAPIAYTLDLLMRWTDASLHLSFGIASVFGVAAGSFAYALATRQFRWEGFASLEDLRTQFVGAMLMGFGGVTALGCTIGQGLSGVSTLALGSFIALLGLVLGAVLTMKWQQR